MASRTGPLRADKPLFTRRLRAHRGQGIQLWEPAPGEGPRGGVYRFGRRGLGDTNLVGAAKVGGHALDVYNKFKSLYCYWPSGIELDVTSILPVEAHQFMSAVDDKVEQLCKLYFAPVELAQLLDACRSFVDWAGNAIENVENVLDAFVKQTEKDGVPLKDMVDALRKVGGHEEKAAARAVLDFQLEKAKKDTEKKAEVIKE